MAKYIYTNPRKYIDYRNGCMKDNLVLSDLDKAKEMWENGEILEVADLLLELVDGIREFSAMCEC